MTNSINIGKQLAAKQKQVLAIAYSPGKNIMTTAFMLWMSGSSIQIFSLMMTGMALVNPINAIANVGATFAKYEGEGVDLKFPKLIFLSLQVVALAVGVYKCSSMGLLPLTSADWTHYITEYVGAEHAGIPC